MSAIYVGIILEFQKICEIGFFQKVISGNFR